MSLLSNLTKFAVRALDSEVAPVARKAAKTATRGVTEAAPLAVTRKTPSRRVANKASLAARPLHSEKQLEMFPGYDSAHRARRKSAFLAGSEVIAPQTSSRQMTPPSPLTLYHATTAPDFDAFRAHGTGKGSTVLGSYETPRQGIFMAEDPRVSDYFVQDNAGGYLPGARVMPLHASIKNPFYLTDDRISDMLYDETQVQKFSDAGVNLKGLYNTPYRWEIFDAAPGSEDDVVGALRKLGYDGAYFNEPTGHMDVPGDINPGVWVAFDPAQVKSATGNLGAFDPSNPSLKKARGGLVVRRAA